MPRYARWAARLSGVIGLGARIPGIPWLLAKGVGLDRRRTLPTWSGASWLDRNEPGGDGREVVLFADTFNNWQEPGNLTAAVRVLQATGHRVMAVRGADSRPLCCGRTYLGTGMATEARAEARRTLDALAPFVERGVPVLGLEPSCLFTFRDEYPAMFPGDPIAGKLARVAKLADEYLAAEIREGRASMPWKDLGAREIRVHGHCHQKAFGTFDATLELLRGLPGASVQAIESGCCGMAGAFGYEKGHYDVSMKMAGLSLIPAIHAAPAARIVAAGTSCRHQIADGAARDAVHPFVVLAEAL